MEFDRDDPTARALTLLSCFTARRHWTGPELADRLGVTTRTLRRDIDRLRQLGYDIEAIAGVGGGYRLQAGADNAPPLFFDADEAVAIIAALMDAAGAAEAGLEVASASAIAKLHHVLPSAVQRSAEALRTNVHAVSLTTAPTVAPSVIAVLAEACRDRGALRFDYVARNRPMSPRRVEPHSLVTVRGAWYLVAFDLDRSDWRTFRLDRIDGVPERTGHGSSNRDVPGGDPVSFVVDQLVGAPTVHSATVQVQVAAAEVLSAMPSLSGRRVRALGRSRCEVTLGSNDLSFVVGQVVALLGLGTASVESVSPEVDERLRHLAGALALITE